MEKTKDEQIEQLGKELEWVIQDFGKSLNHNHPERTVEEHIITIREQMTKAVSRKAPWKEGG